MIRPESAPVYDQVDLKLGIKSSLPSVKPTLALLFLMWREMGRPSELEYATAQGDAIVLRTDIEEALYQRLHEISGVVTLEQFRDKTNNNLMFKAQLEALSVAFELVWKVAKIRFSDGRPNSAERTGGSRFPKRVWFTLNMDLLDAVCGDDADYLKVFFSWLGFDLNADNEKERNIIRFLTIISESAYYKLIDNEVGVVLKVLEKYNSKEQIIRMYNDTSDSSAFNMLAVMLFLLQDYFEYGAYTNTQDIIESNGSGDILWDKTINETFTLLSNNRPYYPVLLTMKRVNDDFDFFKRLHECILTRCTEELRDADLLDLFDIMGVDISDEHIEDFGDKEYVLERIAKELNAQFNTRKQLLLKTLYAYIANSSALDDLDCFSMFGTNSFNLVWEKVCAEVMDNQLQKPIGGLRLPVPLAEQYRDMRHKKLIDLIDKPQWSGTAPNSELFVKQAEDTLIPDLISIVNVDGNYQFVIFDAKYYNIQLEHNKKLRGQPGIESITKQYLYQLAYQPFVEAHQIGAVRNCFLMPTSSAEIVEKGTASLSMLSELGLQDIQVRLLPAEMMYRHYIDNTKLDLQLLNL